MRSISSFLHQEAQITDLSHLVLFLDCQIPDGPPRLWASPGQGNNYTHTHTPTYCTAYTNLPAMLAACWIVWKHLVSVCRLTTPPPFLPFPTPPPLSVRASVLLPSPPKKKTAQSSKHFQLQLETAHAPRQKMETSKVELCEKRGVLIFRRRPEKKHKIW